LSSEDQAVTTRSGGIEPRRQSDHELHQAIFRVRSEISCRRLRLRYGRRLGRRQGQLLGNLATRVASPRRHAELQEIRRYVPEEIRQASRQPVLGRLQLAENRRTVDERD